MGDYNQAKECGEEAIRFVKPVDDINVDSLMLPEATTSMMLGAASLVQRDYLNALELNDKAANSFVSRGAKVGIFGEGCIQLSRGTALMHLGKADESEPIFTSLLQRALTTHRLDTLLHGIIGFSLLFAVQGDIERAVRFYTMAASHPFVGNSIWFSDVSRPFFERYAVEIPSNEIEDVHTTGERPDLWKIADKLLQMNGRM